MVKRATSGGNDHQRPTIDLTISLIAGTAVNRTVIVPKRLMDRMESAAARGSDCRSRAVAMADEFAPRVTPLVT